MLPSYLLILGMAVCSADAILYNKLTPENPEECKKNRTSVTSSEGLPNFCANTINRHSTFKVDESVKRKYWLGFQEISDKTHKYRNINTNRRIPEHFDARRVWSHCDSIDYIYDQSKCGSSWAVATASAMSDRICIATNRRKVRISAGNLLSCCRECSHESYGCLGGDPFQAWKFWHDTGIVTGAGYITKDSVLNFFSRCQNYPFAPDADIDTCIDGSFMTPKCYYNCGNVDPKFCFGEKCLSNFLVTRKAKEYYRVRNNETEIQIEIMTNGPVVAGFQIYEDLIYYKSGIYKHTCGTPQGGHAVKILGWGEENGVKYWIAANSWSSQWGEDGFFRIVRSKEIQNAISAGLPKLSFFDYVCKYLKICI